MMRGSIVPCIYRKTLLLDSSSVNPAAALTLISTDIETISQGIVQLHEVWAALVEISLADQGSIAIDDVDISTLAHEFVRSSLVAVPQEAYIFDGTVRLNMDPSETVHDDEISFGLRSKEEVDSTPPSMTSFLSWTSTTSQSCAGNVAKE